MENTNNIENGSLQNKSEGDALMVKCLFDTLMNNLSDHVYFKDLNSKFIRNNMAHAISFGLDDPGKIVGKSDFDFFTEEAARQAYDDEQNIIKTGIPVIKEEKLTRKDGSEVWFSAIKMPLRDNEANIIGTFGISRDITEKKSTEEALKKEQFLFNAIMNNLSDHIYFKDLNSKFIRNNLAHTQSFGFDNPAQLEGKSDFDFFTEEAARGAFEDEQSIIRSGSPVIKEEKLTRKNKADVWFSAIKMPLHDITGKIIGTFGISRDITKRKRAELENHILYEIMQGVTSTSNLDELLKLIHHALGEVVYAENCFVALYNQKSGLFTFPYFIDKLDPTPLPTAMKKSCSAYVFRTVKPLLLTQAIFDQLVAQNEVELVGSNSPSWIGIPLQTPSKVIGVLVLQHYETENVYSENDVKFLMSIGSQIAIAIDRKMSEEEIRLKNELLQAINAEKDKFFSIIAHDLRGPLSSFVAATQIITEEVQTMGIEEIKEMTGYMKKSATNIYSLLENLLEWSRLKRGGTDFAPVNFNPEERINTCIDVLNESARRKGIDIKVEIPVGLVVKADKNMFDTLIRNLLSNAIKFTNASGQIYVSAKRSSENSVNFEIRDSGIGMVPELRDKLFQLNEKTSRPGTDGEPSTGLGLLLCKEFVEKHGGKIWVESSVGKGSTFHFIFPDNAEPA